MVRLVLALPLRGLVRPSLTMTDGNCNFGKRTATFRQSFVALLLLFLESGLVLIRH